jgi:hypothetical protein
MSSPKEKAIELVTSMSFSKAKVADYETGQRVDIPGNIFAKQCALVAVDEILSNPMFFADWGMVHFWQQVKKEIEKL